MASVFLSYDHEDAARAALVAAALENAGHSVWWDRHIHGGAEYQSVIESAVEHADAVVVLWSERSIKSAWVRDEAAEGREQGKLIPVLIGPVKPPMGFRQYQTIDLSTRRRASEPKHLDELLGAIAKISTTPVPTRAASTARVTQTGTRTLANGWWLLGAIAVIILAAVSLLAWRAMSRPSVAVVAVMPADGSPAGRALARDLFTQLGSLQVARLYNMQLIGPGANPVKNADFQFEVAPDGDPKAGAVNLMLLGSDRALIWSKSFNLDAGGVSALKQRMAYMAGEILDCALDAQSARSAKPDRQTLKLFLNGCSIFAETYRLEPRNAFEVFSQVVARAPRFEPAWSKLLLAQAALTRGEMVFYGRSTPGDLPKYIKQAEKLNPRLPEIYIAKSALLPLEAYKQHERLLNEALRLNPNNPDLLASRCDFLEYVGRSNEAIQDAARAAELNPLSPAIRSNYIQTLFYAGQITAASEELSRAERLWPGAATMEDARFRFESRFGDARAALRMYKSKGVHRKVLSPDMEAFLLARINPTPENVQRAIAATRNPDVADEVEQMLQVAQILGQFGREEELYSRLLHWPKLDRVAKGSAVFFRPALRKFRHDPRFMLLAKHWGLLDYWRSTGKWPEFCFDADLPYDCKAEAAKVMRSDA